MKKVVINTCYGGFGLSDEAVIRYHELIDKPLSIIKDSWLSHYFHIEEDNPDLETMKRIASIKYSARTKDESEIYNTLYSKYHFFANDVDRADPNLIRVVEELGETANGDYAKLKIVEIPDDVDFIIQEYDGQEWIAENHRTWE